MDANFWREGPDEDNEDDEADEIFEPKPIYDHLGRQLEVGQLVEVMDFRDGSQDPSQYDRVDVALIGKCYHIVEIVDGYAILDDPDACGFGGYELLRLTPGPRGLRGLLGRYHDMRI